MHNLHAEFKPYKEMWYLARDYFFKQTNWMQGILGQIDWDEITLEINKACSDLLKIEKVNFKEKWSSAEIAKDLRKLYEGFKPYLPLICALRNPTLKWRHWDKIQELTCIS